MFGKKRNLSGHSPKEIRMAAEYLQFKRFVSNGRAEIAAYATWLGKEMEETEKLWANFHRYFVVTYIYLRSVIPNLQKKSYDYEEEKPYVLSGSFRVQCPFDEDSYYEVRYSEEHPVDVAQIPDVFCEPHSHGTGEDKELTEEEYIALFLYRICERNLEKVKKLLRFENDPLEFAIEMMRESKEINDEYGLELWTFAAAYEQNPFEGVDFSKVLCHEYNNYLDYLGI